MGHFAITLYGTHLRSLTDGQNDHAATLLRHRLGDVAGDFAVVYARA